MLPFAVLTALVGAGATDGAGPLVAGAGPLVAGAGALDAGAAGAVVGAALLVATTAALVVDELADGVLDPLLQPANAVITAATTMRGRRCL
jgi:hypothetical protein